MNPAPLLLGPNQPAGRPYRGGEGIARFRGLSFGGDDHTPEDFVGSTTAVHGSDSVGLTTLPDGTLLRDAIAADPTGFLGADHVARLGADPALLVKLLDTGERLFVHTHPDDGFARTVLHEPHGKTEAWIVVDAPADGHAYLGFRRDVGADELARWFAEQNAAAMLAVMHRVELHTGDTLFVPAGLAHAIGPGLTLVELQQPVDLSLILEHGGFPGLSPENTLLGLSLDEVLPAIRTTRLGADELAALQGSFLGADAARTRLFPAAAAPFFAATHLRVRAPAQAPLRLEPGFAILVVIDGEGTLRWRDGELDLTRGATALLPHAAGEVELSGRLEAILSAPGS